MADNILSTLQRGWSAPRPFPVSKFLQKQYVSFANISRFTCRAIITPHSLSRNFIKNTPAASKKVIKIRKSWEPIRRKQNWQSVFTRIFTFCHLNLSKISTASTVAPNHLELSPFFLPPFFTFTFCLCTFFLQMLSTANYTETFAYIRNEEGIAVKMDIVLYDFDIGRQGVSFNHPKRL